MAEALRYFSGVTERVMIDNTRVVVLRGTGREMVPVPEMAAFGERFGFQFAAHEIGDANRMNGWWTWILRGEDPAGIPMRNVVGKKLVLNNEVAGRLGISFPADLRRSAIPWRLLTFGCCDASIYWIYRLN